MDRAYYEEIAGPLYGLLIRLDDRLSGKDVALIAEVIEANERGQMRASGRAAARRARAAQ